MNTFLASVLDKFGPHLALLAAILLTTCALCAEDVNATAAPPKSLPMPAALLVAKADQEIVKVRTALVESLRKAQADATKKGDLDGALAIKARIEQVSADLPAKAVPVTPPVLSPGVYVIDFWHRGEEATVAKNRIERKEGSSGSWSMDKSALVIKWDNGGTTVCDAMETPAGAWKEASSGFKLVPKP